MRLRGGEGTKLRGGPCLRTRPGYSFRMAAEPKPGFIADGDARREEAVEPWRWYHWLLGDPWARFWNRIGPSWWPKIKSRPGIDRRLYASSDSRPSDE
jgi:hypothetical protein